jgi:valyl-tRNA synthetase
MPVEQAWAGETPAPRAPGIWSPPMPTEIPKAYDPQQVEGRIYAYWTEAGVFDAEVDPHKPPFCIVIPPPNVTGILHMGHALDNAIQDLLTRWKRMSGYAALWLPGTDHAGIATQNVTEKELAQEGLTRHDLGREAFIARVWEVKERHHTHIVEQLRRLGGSMDWRRERFTLDEQCSRAVREAFVTLYDRGLIYRGAYMINWCPRCETGLSDLEVEHEEHQGNLWHIHYPQPDGSRGVIVATTRPETMLGDTAVAVHPDDERYRDLIGKTVTLPLMDRAIPIVADDAVEQEFGTGAVKVTPAHDPNDLEIAQRHNLPSLVVIGSDGKMTAEAGAYAGLDRYDCRKQVVADLEEFGLLESIESYTHAVGHCQRCRTVVEPLVSEQWFVKMAPLAEKGLAAVRGQAGVPAPPVRFVPERWTKIYTDWLENIRDWPISRQLWWGHPIPVWYCDQCGQQICTREDPAKCPGCGGCELRPDPDVLDTWFSSALWPFSTLGWPEQTPELEYFYPTSVLVTAYDIIFFWVARMIMMAMEIREEKPFDEVFIHGLVRDEKGRKISKSLGNNIDPIELIERYGADALRFALVQLITHGQDLTYSEDRMVGARNFCNKLWNASRFVLMNQDGVKGPCPFGSVEECELHLPERWILSRQAAVMEDVDRTLQRYDLAQAADALYAYTWTELCDWFVELSKADLYGDNTDRVEQMQWLLKLLLSDILRALHPFMPFITEEIWQLGGFGEGSISLAPYPTGNPAHRDPEAERQMGMVMEITNQIRSWRAQLGLQPQQKISVQLAADEAATAVLREVEHGMKALARLEAVEYLAGETPAPRGAGDPAAKALTATVQGVTIILPLAGAIEDPQAQLDRLHKRMADLEKDKQRAAGKLSNDKFVANAKPEIVAQERERLAEIEAQMAHLHEQMALFESLL